MPARLPAVPRTDLAAAWQPARDVGGDYYDVLPLPGDRVAICIADVMGKGVSASLLMANVQALVRAFTPSVGGPDALCAQLNAALCAQPAAGLFVTFVAAILDVHSGVLRYSNGGHTPPLLVRADGGVERLEAGGAVLGVVPGAVYSERAARLVPGDRLLLLTDGVVEAMNPAGEEFGEERIAALARAHSSAPVEHLRDALLEAVAAFTDGERQDDVTLLVLGRRATV